MGVGGALCDVCTVFFLARVLMMKHCWLGVRVFFSVVGILVLKRSKSDGILQDSLEGRVDVKKALFDVLDRWRDRCVPLPPTLLLWITSLFIAGPVVLRLCRRLAVLADDKDAALLVPQESDSCRVFGGAQRSQPNFSKLSFVLLFF